MIGLWLPQWVYWASQFFLKSCPALSTWWCPALRLSVFTCFPCLRIHLSPSLPIHLSPSLAHGVSRCLPIHLSLFTCLTSCISQSGLWCPALWTFIVTCLTLFVVRCLCSLVSLHLSPSVARGVRLPIFLWTYFPSFVFQCAYTSVRLFGCLSSLVSLHLSPIMPCGDRLSSSLDVFLYFICLAVCLVLSGSPDVSLYLSPFICLSVWPVLFGWETAKLGHWW